MSEMRAAGRYFRANPQVLVLLVICVVLGLGTFIAVVIAIGTSGGSYAGDPSGVVGLAGILAGAGQPN